MLLASGSCGGMLCVCVPCLTTLPIATFIELNERECSISGMAVAGEGRSTATNRCSNAI